VAELLVVDLHPQRSRGGLLHLGQGRRRPVAKWSPLPIQRAVITTQNGQS
jgi:hypothetical protein